MTSEPRVLKEFVTFRPFGAEASGSRLLQPLRNLLATSRKEDERSSVSGGLNSRARPTRVVLWVDDKPNPSVSVIAGQCAVQRILLMPLSSTAQLVDWVADQGGLFAAPNVRIITNRYRHVDGGDGAAQTLLQWVRGSERLAQSELLVFCKEVGRVAHLANATNTAVTDDGGIALRFAMFEPLERLRAHV